MEEVKGGCLKRLLLREAIIKYRVTNTGLEPGSATH